MAHNSKEYEAKHDRSLHAGKAAETRVRCRYFEFPVPIGWQYTVYSDEIILRHGETTIQIYPHAYPALTSLPRAMMRSGSRDLNISLTPRGVPKPISQDSVAVNLEGIDGETARFVGTLSPYGGGAFVFAVSPSGEPWKELSKKTDAIALGMKYFRIDESELAEFVSGTYEDNQGNQFLLLGGGVFAKRIKGHHLTYDSNAYQESVEPTGMAAESEPFGTWTVTGDRKQGTITVAYDDGSREFIDYLVTKQSDVKPLKMKLSGRDVKPIPDSRHPEIMQRVSLVIENPQRRAARQ